MTLIRTRSHTNGRRSPAKTISNTNSARKKEKHLPRASLKKWIGIDEKHQNELHRFLTEFGYLTLKSAPTKDENKKIGYWIEKALIDLPLLLDEWYSYSNKTNVLKGVDLTIK